MFCVVSLVSGQQLKKRQPAELESGHAVQLGISLCCAILWFFLLAVALYVM